MKVYSKAHPRCGCGLPFSWSGYVWKISSKGEQLEKLHTCELCNMTTLKIRMKKGKSFIGEKK